MTGIEADAIKLLPKIYEDIAQPSTKEIGTVLGRSVKALLFPIRSLLWCYEQIENTIIIGVTKRLDNVPDENLQTPKPEIAVPLLQAFTYTAQNDELREMYLNLLANSMINTKDKEVHPSFVEIIKQMDSLDAQLFKHLSQNIGYTIAINPRIIVKDTTNYYPNFTPEWFLGWVISDYDIFNVSASLIRLKRLGLIDLNYQFSLNSVDYNELLNSDILIEILKENREIITDKDLVLDSIKSCCNINDFGKQFASSCI